MFYLKGYFFKKHNFDKILCLTQISFFFILISTKPSDSTTTLKCHQCSLIYTLFSVPWHSVLNVQITSTVHLHKLKRCQWHSIVSLWLTCCTDNLYMLYFHQQILPLAQYFDLRYVVQVAMQSSAVLQFKKCII